MQTFHLKVDDDGRVTIPNSQPGETITIQFPRKGEPLSLATAQTDEERAEVIAEIRRLGREIRKEMGDPQEELSLTPGELLYAVDGLPK